MSCRPPYIISTRRRQWMLFSADGGEANAVRFVLAFVSPAIFSRSLCFLLIHLHDIRWGLATCCMSNHVAIYLRYVVAATAARFSPSNACCWALWRGTVTSTKHQQSTELFFLRNIRNESIIQIATKKEKKSGFFWSTHSLCLLSTRWEREKCAI